MFGDNAGGHAGRGERNGSNGAGGVVTTANVANAIFPRAGNVMIVQVQAERGSGMQS